MGASGLVVDYRTRNFHVAVISPGSFASSPEKLPTQPPTLSGMGNQYWSMGYGLWDEGYSAVDWGDVVHVYLSCCVLHRGSNCSLSRAMDGRIMRYGIISSCQSATTSEIVKYCWSRLCK